MPVIALSRGDDFSKKRDSVLAPSDPVLKPAFAETVWAECRHVIAVIRGGEDACAIPSQLSIH